MSVHKTRLSTTGVHGQKVYQRGFAFLPFLLGNWQTIGMVLGAIVVFGYYKHCEYVKKDRDQIIASLKVAAAENDRRVKTAIAQAQKDKETADEAHKRTVARLQRDVKRLRDNPPSSFLPPAAPGSSSPQRATLDRAEFDRALRDYRTEIIGLLEEGGAGIAALDTAKEWAK